MAHDYDRSADLAPDPQLDAVLDPLAFVLLHEVRFQGFEDLDLAVLEVLLFLEFLDLLHLPLVVSLDLLPFHYHVFSRPDHLLPFELVVFSGFSDLSLVLILQPNLLFVKQLVHLLNLHTQAHWTVLGGLDAGKQLLRLVESIIRRTCHVVQRPVSVTRLMVARGGL